MASKPNISDSNYAFDKEKQYTQIVFQQGKPILDVDLNDMSNALHAQATSALVEKMGYGPSQLDYKDWAMTAVNAVNPIDTRNNDNFALSLGRLDSRKGVVDTACYRAADTLSPNIIFDYGKILTDVNQVGTDRPFSNYLLKGTVTSSDLTSIVDDEKAFSDDHRITGFDEYEVIASAYADVATSTKPSIVNVAVKDHVIRIKEGGCRIRFSDGTEKEVSTVLSNKVTWVGDLASPPTVGSTYYILPPNTLTDYRELYDAAFTQADSLVNGLGNLPQLVTYVQVFEEDVSSVEDTSLVSAGLGYETTHRTQLRWCVRVAMVWSSVEGDTHNNQAVTSLKGSHVLGLLSDNKFVDYQAITDAADINASGHDGYLQSHFWQQVDSAGVLTETTIGDQESPYKELGLTPAHFFSAEENNLDRLYWAFLKGVFQKVNNSDLNDFVILNIFNAESKSGNSSPTNLETLSPLFVPGARTDVSVPPIAHAFLSTGSAFQRAIVLINGLPVLDMGSQPAFFKAPPRVFHNQVDLSVDNMKSRTLYGLRGGIIYGANAPLVFSSVSAHLSFVDQIVLGMSGIGSALGATSEGYRIPSAIDYTLSNTSASVAQAGYGVGSLKMLSPISASTVNTEHTDGSFLTGTSSYLLRDKGTRGSHTVNVTDEDLGWSLYKKEGNTLVSADDNGYNTSDFSIRGWDEGIAQAVAFQQGINFRKLAIKTTAHKSMDLFTISETPNLTNNQVGGATPFPNMDASSTAFQIPVDQSQDVNGNLFLDSYSGAVNSSTYANFNSNEFIPANRIEFDPKLLLQQYQPTGGIRSYNRSVASDRDISLSYGAWNRFSRNAATLGAGLWAGGGLLANADDPIYSMDLWHNRCTAMRLRYHIGDFYPGAVDSRGIPSNELVDSLNLFMKVEPLSLTHWMTMPKHQHSVLEGSFSFAEGIEALLKVAHGLGDTQKLVNGENEPLIQAESPALSEAGNFVIRNEGDVDPLNLPFDHYRHPFVHWYHPAMHKIKAPHPDGTTDVYTNIGSVDFNLTVYPKFGRRSLITPALVPFKLKSKVSFGTTNDDVVITRDNANEVFPAQIGTTPDQDTVDASYNVDVSEVTSANNIQVSGRATFPYELHASQTTDTNTTTYVTDNSGNFTVRNNQISFPAIGSDGEELAPGPVFIPASRIYASQAGSITEAYVGFNQLLNSDSVAAWNDISSNESYFPYDERSEVYSYEAGGTQQLPNNFDGYYDAWSTPVLRASLNTHTVAGVVDLVRTSFETGLNAVALSSDYTFTMPAILANKYDTTISPGFYSTNQAPSVGPDNSLDTLFVGDLGTALGGFSDRSGFISPLNFGVPMRIGAGVMPNDMNQSDQTVRDSFELAEKRMANENSLLRNAFFAFNQMGLQQKLMWNCSFRVLHTRPGGIADTSTAPKSLTEVIMAHNRSTGTMANITFPSPTNAFKKPFIHLLSTHPSTNPSFPNKNHMAHLYPLVSDSTGGSHSETLTDGKYDYSQSAVRTSSMGDTFAADPFDYMLNKAVFSANVPNRDEENLEVNSGVEIDLITELGMLHNNKSTYNLDEPLQTQINGIDVSLVETMPTANELTLPGDHELVFVLYTGHYGAKMFDVNDEVSLAHIPPVAGCHLTATLEVNRPSERVNSTANDEHHYGIQVNGSPIKTYAIPSTKSSS